MTSIELDNRNILPFVMIRANENIDRIKDGDSYTFTSTMPNSRLIVKGANVIVDRDAKDGVEILGYGKLTAASETGIFKSGTRLGKQYQSVFTNWHTGKEHLHIDSQVLNHLFARRIGKKKRHSIEPVSEEFYSILTQHISEPDGMWLDKLKSSVEDLKFAESYDDAFRSSSRETEYEGAQAIPAEEARFRIVTIFYGTDRMFGSKKTISDIFIGERDAELHLGKAEISIPLLHKTGNLESAPFWKIVKRRDPSKYVTLMGVNWFLEEDAFLEEISSRIAASPLKDAFVFIHGYNVSFENAARRTAQLAYDLKFQGAPILYSWPSKNKTSAYLADEATIEWTVPHLTRFLEMIASETQAKLIHVIGHSMGNRALVNAMRNLDTQILPFKPIFKQVLLTAPDIDAGVFKNLSREIVETAERLTLYASSNDKAIRASQKFHKYARVGQTEPDITIVDGIDTIDASTVETDIFSLGHSYASESRSVLNDIHDVIHRGEPPDDRFNLIRQNLGALVYWAFKP